MKKTNRKSGFTLVELMVVAAIIAILAAIIVPLLSSNRDSAIASEAANLCSMAATQSKIYWAQTGNWPADTDALPNTIQTEMENAKYFDEADVTIDGTGPDDYDITVEADVYSSGSQDLILSETGAWSGGVVDEGYIQN